MKRLPLRVTEGRLPQTDTEILIPEHVSSNGGVSIAVGETLRLQVGLRQDSEGYTLWQNAAFHVEDEEHLNQLVEKTYTAVSYTHLSLQAIVPLYHRAICSLVRSDGLKGSHSAGSPSRFGSVAP